MSPFSLKNIRLAGNIYIPSVLSFYCLLVYPLSWFPLFIVIYHICVFLNIFFWYGLFLSLYWIYYSIIYVLVFWPWGMWDLSYPSRDWTHTPCIRSQNSNYWTVRKVPTIYVYLLFSHSIIANSLQTHEQQYSRLPCPSPSPRARSNSGSLSQWSHPAIVFSIVPFSSCLQSFPASGCFPVSQFFA